jgi:hypothetical protein
LDIKGAWTWKIYCVFFFCILPTFNILNILADARKVKNWIKTYVQCLFKEFCHLSFERQDFRKWSFFINTFKDWNNLPPDIAAAKSLESFKAQVAKLFE